MSIFKATIIVVTIVQHFAHFGSWGGVPLEPTFATDSMTLGLVAKVIESQDKKHKKVYKDAGFATSPQQDVAHPGLSGSRSQPDLGSGGFSSRQDAKLLRQTVNP